jgi:enamine deaminase RidA (YjgF/YER057c/UK114 family)
MRENISSGTKWELEIGYSRLVKVGNMIFVSGTTSIDENGDVVGVGDSYGQTKYILQKISKSLERVGTNISAVTRTRIFTTKIDEWKDIGRAHAEYFKEIRPATTMVEVKSLMEPELIVEIETDAILVEYHC